MPEVSQLDRHRKKHSKNISSKQNLNDNPIKSYLHPKGHLYTRKEFELLDTIFSDEPESTCKNNEEVPEEDFWLNKNEDLVSSQQKQNNMSNNLKWFGGGILVTSLILTTFFQFKIHELTKKDNIKIVFHKAAHITTDKTLDRDITRGLTENEIKLAKASSKQVFPISFNFFSRNQKEVKALDTKETKLAANNANVREEKDQIVSHVIQNGDSLWLIAKEYYGDPSPENIRKIQEANDLRIVKYLYPGSKLIIPL